jgi:hypothetical protein
MKKYITTYFYHDCEDQGASYGNIFLPLDKRNKIYWQTIYTLFFSSIVANKNSGVSYVLFTNVAIFPFRDSIEGLGVKIYDNLILTERNPSKWATVKFFFDVIDFINSHNDFKAEDSFVMLDTDVVALRDATALFDSLSALNNAIAYVFDELSVKDRDFHGVNVPNLEKIGTNLFGKEIKIKRLIGGEFFCFKKYHIPNLFSYFNLFRDANYSKQITTEEQILTLVDAREPWEIFPEGIFRVWTTPRVFKMPLKNFNYIFLHLPSEKEDGLCKLFNATIKIDPYKTTVNDFNILFYRCLPLKQPYYFYVYKLIGKFIAYLR